MHPCWTASVTEEMRSPVNRMEQRLRTLTRYYFEILFLKTNRRFGLPPYLRSDDVNITIRGQHNSIDVMSDTRADVTFAHVLSDKLRVALHWITEATSPPDCIMYASPLFRRTLKILPSGDPFPTCHHGGSRCCSSSLTTAF